MAIFHTAGQCLAKRNLLVNAGRIGEFRLFCESVALHWFAGIKLKCLEAGLIWIRMRNSCGMSEIYTSYKHNLTVVFLLYGSDNLIPVLPNTAYSCRHQVSVITWFRSARPVNDIPVPKTSTLLGVRVHCVSQWNCFKETEESCGLRGSVFET